MISVAVVSACGGSTNRGKPTATTVGTAPNAGLRTGAGTTKVPVRLQWDKVAAGAPIAYAGAPRALDAPDPAHPAPAGVYLWNDLSGWHVRVVRNPASPPVEVTVAANEQKDSAVKIEKVINSTEPLPPTAASVTVKLPATASSSGFDMSTGFFTNKLSFTVRAGTTALPPGQIYLGSTPSPATENPVLVTRSSAPH